ncbi:hypothetical protein [Kitasatospora sp. NPDC093806]|uniref:hypothetical protein n=1 Tax=Kitasatospora sp. NPDC093806 TaxID=3155075 RepID=UPI00341E554F
MHPRQPLLRGIRATVFAAVCVLASLGLHEYAGGAPVGPLALAGATGLTALAAYPAAGRRRRTRSLLGACLAAQIGLHHFFSAAARGPAVCAGPHHAHHTAADHGGSELGGAGADSALSHLTGAMEPEMLLVHTLMALLCAWWLGQGEAALAGILLGATVAVGRWLRRLGATTGHTSAHTVRVARPVHRDGPAPALLATLATTVSRRGPPGYLSTLTGPAPAGPGHRRVR